MKLQYQRNIKMLVNLLVFVVTLLACIFLIPRVIVFFMPFVVGWIISWIANPLVQFLERKMKIRRKAGTVVVIVCVIAAVSGAGYLAISFLIKQLQGFIGALPGMWEGLESDITHIGTLANHLFVNLSPAWIEALNAAGDMIGEFIKELPANVESVSFSRVGSVVGNIANVIIAVIMCMLSSYFFIAERDYVFRWIRKMIPASVHEKYDVVYRSIRQAAGGYFKAQLKIEVWIYLLIFIGLTILKIDYAFLIALAIALLDFLPFFGSGAVFLPWAVFKLLSGDYVMAVGFVIIWGVVQLVRQLIQPKIMGDSIGMAPIPTLFLLYIGYKLAGVGGMILAVPIGIILVNMNEAGLFDTPKLSLRILIANLNRYRRLDESDKKILEKDKETK